MAASMSALAPSHPLKRHEPISAAPSSALEIASSARLMQHIDEVAPLETETERGRREEMLQVLTNIFRKWIIELAVQRGEYPDEESASDAGGNIFVSGSYKLCVSTKSSDIDTICVAPHFVKRVDFFDMMPGRLTQYPGISIVNILREAKVPLIELEFDSVSVDLQFVSLPLKSIPRTLNILDDNILQGLEDEGAVFTLNGPRVNELIYRLIDNFETFKAVLRVLRRWGKVRGLYGNKNGFLGGVNFAILSAYICQLFPNLSPAACIYQFFKIFKDWAWPRAIYINEVYTTPLNFEVWDPENNPRSRRDVMPILTPAYPAMNSSYNVNRSTLAVMMTEIQRGFEVCDKILTNPNVAEHNWAQLFAPTDFFLRFDKYILVDISARTPEELRRWQAYMGSRLRFLVSNIEMNEPPFPFSTIYPFPEEIAHAPWHKAVPPAPPTLAAPPSESVAVDSPAATPLPDERAPPVPLPEPLEGWGRAVDESYPLSDATGGAPDLPMNQSAGIIPPGNMTVTPSVTSLTSLDTLEVTTGLQAAFLSPTGGQPAIELGKVDPATQPLPATDSLGTSHGQLADESTADGPSEVSPTQVVSWFIGIQFDIEKLKTKTVNLTRVIEDFKFNINWKERKEGMTFSVDVRSWKDLPEDIFPQGRKIAEQQRRVAKQWYDNHMAITPFNVLRINTRAATTWVAGKSQVAPGTAAGNTLATMAAQVQKNPDLLQAASRIASALSQLYPTQAGGSVLDLSSIPGLKPRAEPTSVSGAGATADTVNTSGKKRLFNAESITAKAVAAAMMQGHDEDLYGPRSAKRPRSPSMQNAGLSEVDAGNGKAWSSPASSIAVVATKPVQPAGPPRPVGPMAPRGPAAPVAPAAGGAARKMKVTLKS